MSKIVTFGGQDTASLGKKYETLSGLDKRQTR